MKVKYLDLWIWNDELKEYQSQRSLGWQEVDSIEVSNDMEQVQIFVGKLNEPNEIIIRKD
jgi:ribosome-binding factor A